MTCARRRAVRVDLLVLGLGQRADRQRGIQGLREDARAGRRCSRVVSILLTYLLVSVSTLMYAGDGTEGLGLATRRSPTTCSARSPSR